MQNELNQEEIDAMVRAARSGGQADSGAAREPQVEPWDIRRAGQIGRAQLQAITHLHEGFARNLTTALGTYLRAVFTAALVSAEHLTYREFTGRIHPRRLIPPMPASASDVGVSTLTESQQVII